MTYTFCPECGKQLIKQALDGQPRLKCPACGFIFWDNPIPVVAAIVELGGNIILARNRDWPEKWYGIITGFLDKAELPEAAILREVKEELGLDSEIVSFVGHYLFEQKNQVIMVYHVRAEGEIALNDELVDYKLVPPEKVKPWGLGTGPAMRDWLKARGLLDE
jgi:NAD+ diphosphatase